MTKAGFHDSVPDGWTRSDYEALKVLWFAGATVKEIAATLNCGKGRISGVTDRRRDVFGYRGPAASVRNHGRVLARPHMERVNRISGQEERRV